MGCTAIVTGAGRGIGRALALSLAGAAADVVVAARSMDSWTHWSMRSAASEVARNRPAPDPQFIDGEPSSGAHMTAETDIEPRAASTA
jgi:NAD(P)-dependent dehydrogenase (short-subunit alcohol dehydrogenase family)